MEFSPNGHLIPNRQSIRLQTHDYSSPGPYFITISTWQRRRVFGDVRGQRVELSPLGVAAQQCWLAIPQCFIGVTLDAFVIMPDHMHGIVHLPAHGRRAPLSGVVRRFKLGVTQWSREYLASHRIWHRNYYERIVRDRRALDAIRRYIVANPAKWNQTHPEPP